MDETNEQQNPLDLPKQKIPKESSKTPKSKKLFLVVLLVLLTAVLSAFGTYLWRESVAHSAQDQQAKDISSYKSQISDLKQQVSDLKKSTNNVKTDTKTACTEKAPNSANIDNIKASVTSGNTQPLEGYMASTVNVILAASEAYGPQTPAQATADITNFLSTDNTSWDYNFSLPPATLSVYQGGDYAQYFSPISLVGKASNGKVISFSFDCNGKIDTVFLMQ